jgi:hypothetical protein
MLRRSLIAGVIAIAGGVFSTHAQQASQPAQTPAPQGDRFRDGGETAARRPDSGDGRRCRLQSWPRFPTPSRRRS